ncbi:MAG: DUF1475 domain-containing protein [Bacteroidota bacterium]|nr:DUF1475 domain-containing protein [Bacteroidota bacterium]
MIYFISAMLKNLLIFLFSILLIGMVFTIIQTSLQSNLFEALPDLIRIPWMKATLIDFYANVAALFLWIAYKEKKHYKKILWLILLILLGSVATCIYILKELFQLKEKENIKDLLIKQNN